MQIVPTNQPVAREDSNDVVFRNVKGKWAAVAQEIARMHKTGRPVLVGTTSVETSEFVAQMLADKGIRHEVCSLFHLPSNEYNVVLFFFEYLQLSVSHAKNSPNKS